MSAFCRSGSKGLRCVVSLSVLSLGCDSLLGLNHDYSLRLDSTGGASGTASASTSEPDGGAGGVKVTPNGSTTASRGGAAVGGEPTGPSSSNSTRINSGGVAGAGASSPATSGAESGGTSESGVGTVGAMGGMPSTSRTSAGGAAAGATDSDTAATGGAANSSGSYCTACHHAISLQSESATALHGGNGLTGVTYQSYRDRCPSGQVLVGYAGTLRNDVYKVGGSGLTQVASLLAVCGTLTLDASGQVTVTPNYAIAPRGTDATAGNISQLCSSNQVVVGFAGREGPAINQMGLVCAPLQHPAACCCSALVPGTSYLLPPDGDDEGTAYSASCPVGQVALGQDLTTATTAAYAGEEWVSFLGLLCGTPIPVEACSAEY